jgi:hypothetical protein
LDDGNVLLNMREKIMIASYGEVSGFAAVGPEELVLVNGGKGGGGGATISGSKNGVTVSVPVSNNASINVSLNGGINGGKPQITGGGISLTVKL